MQATKTVDARRIKLIRDNLGLTVDQLQALLDNAGLPMGRGTITKMRKTYREEVGYDPTCRPKEAEARQATRTREIDIPQPSPISGGIDIPESLAKPYTRVVIDDSGRWVVLSDVHLPHHDVATVRAAVRIAKDKNANLLLNGDILDCPELSDHERHKDDVKFKTEIEMGRHFFEWIRSQLPKARIIYKEGNHEERLPRYLARNAPAIEHFVSMPDLLEIEDHGIEWVDNRRIAMLGSLPVLHGHEYKGSGGLKPAKWLYDKTASSALCGHFHRTDTHYKRGLMPDFHGVYTLGCACFLHPYYFRLNEWNHGFAEVEISGSGSVHVDNHRLRNGEII